MRSNYRPIGDYIQLVDERNKGLRVKQLLGLSISKQFIPSVANIIGTDMEKYKIIRKNQFACSIMQVRRDKKMPVALLHEVDEAIISQAYPVFEVKDEHDLLPEYLMMWFSREEFDREACFYAVGGVRGSLEWDDFCAMKFPLPLIEKQREIVAEYNTVKNRIELNNQLIQKLEETAQSIYKQWFVDFEFPNENGNPYKSSGGVMVYNVELDKEIPAGWKYSNFENICNIIDGDRGRNYPSQEHFFEEEHCLFLNAGNVSKTGFNFSKNCYISRERDELLRNGKLKRGDIILTTRGTVGNVAYFSEFIEYSNLRINSGMVILRPNNHYESHFLYSLMRSQAMMDNITNYMSGSAQPQLPITDLKRIPVVIAQYDLILMFSKIISSIQNQIELVNLENRKVMILKDILFSKLATIEN